MTPDMDRLAFLLLTTIRETLDVANIAEAGNGYRFTVLDGDPARLRDRCILTRELHDGDHVAAFNPNSVAALAALDFVAAILPLDNITHPQTVWISQDSRDVISSSLHPLPGSVAVTVTAASISATHGNATVTASRTETGYMPPIFTTSRTTAQEAAA